MKKALVLPIVILMVLSAQGQTLNEQFNELKENSESYKQYKVIDRAGLDAFWSMTMDSVNNLKQQITSTKADNMAKAQTIDQLNTTISTKDERIEDLELQTSTIEVFGSDLNKSTFIFISFFTAGALVIILAFVLFKYKENNIVARSKVRDYEKLNNDFEEYKRNALEKQMKLRRDLQTERNKLEEARN